MTLESLEHREIDTIIDQGKAFGLYDIEKVKFIAPDEDCARSDDFLSEADSAEFLCEPPREEAIPWEVEHDPRRLETYKPFKRSDSEVTIIRVKRESLKFRQNENSKWASINDEAVPGDGTHLGESPSLVNLVTYVKSSTVPPVKQDAGEYMVPISTWDPIGKKKCISSGDIVKAFDVVDAADKTALNSTSNTPEIEEIHRSLNMFQMSESRLNFPYMIKQKQSPRPGALFSNKSQATPKTDEIVAAVAGAKELDQVKAPSRNQRKTLRQVLVDFMRTITCTCCLAQTDIKLSKRKQKLTQTTDVAVQTSENESEVFIATI